MWTVKMADLPRWEDEVGCDGHLSVPNLGHEVRVEIATTVQWQLQMKTSRLSSTPRNKSVLLAASLR